VAGGGTHAAVDDARMTELGIGQQRVVGVDERLV
jgi:hypothetical protein